MKEKDQLQRIVRLDRACPKELQRIVRQVFEELEQLAKTAGLAAAVPIMMNKVSATPHREQSDDDDYDHDERRRHMPDSYENYISNDY